MKKVIALLLILVFALSLFACSNNEGDAPEGMTSATVEGAPFKLYVPTNWALNTQSGISSAYLNSMQFVSVSADWIEAKEETLEEFYRSCISSYEKDMKDFKLADESTMTVDKKEAKKLTAAFKYGDKEYKLMRAVIKHGDCFVIFTYKAVTDLYDTYLENANEMLKAFKLTEKSEIIRPDETDDKTPEGMKIASHDDAEYRLYVPKNWIVNSKNSVSGAYHSEENRSNVTVTSYTPETSMSIEDYFKATESQYNNNYDNYTRVSYEKDKKLGDRYAEEFRFTFEVDGSKYESKQIIAIYNQMFYVLTYTSTPENYDLLKEDLDKITHEFVFR